MKHLLVFVACVTVCHACTCAPFSSLEEQFCFSDFVSHVNVTGRIKQNSTDFQFYHIYSVQHIRVYRVNPEANVKFQNPSNTTELSNEIYTATQSAACGIVLKIGTEYLLGGRLDAEDGRLYSNLCGLHREWSRVSTADRAALANYTCNETLTENFY